MPLASLLPGLRDLRAPFAGGLLWLLYIWLALTARIANPATLLEQWPWSSMASIVDSLGSIGATAVAAFCAYLIGAVVVDPLNAAIESFTLRTIRSSKRSRLQTLFFRFNKRKIERINGQVVGLTQNALWTQVDRVSQADGQVDEFFRDSVRYLFRGDDSGVGEEVFDSMMLGVIGPNISLLEPHLRFWVQSEYRSMSDRLLINHPMLFSAIDRLNAESQFRYAVAPPLAAISLLLSYLHSPLWLALLVGSVLLVRNAQTLSLSYVQRLVDAWAAGAIVPPSIESIEAIASQHLAPSNGKP